MTENAARNVVSAVWGTVYAVFRRFLLNKHRVGCYNDPVRQTNTSEGVKP